MTTQKQQVDFSIVIPVYFNEGLLKNTMAELKEQVLARNPALKAEVTFVDDGSGDGSLKELLEVRAADPQLVRVIKLTRNFGQVNALRAGFAHARGRCAVAMSADGQDPASLINDMLKAHFDEGCEVVVCTREGRDESVYRIVTSRVFYALMRRLAFPGMPAGGFDYLLLGRRALDTLLRMSEAHPFLQGQVLWMGYKTRFLEYQRRQRAVGASRWSFGRKLTYLLDGVLNYSFLPIRLVSFTGLVIALLGFAYAVLVFALKLLYDHPVKGWTPLMIVILLLGGFQMLTLGVFGEYMWRILAQVQRREPYVVDAVYGPDGEEGAGAPSRS
ncbi:MAG: glycosyltransferase family 2 protein [Kiritimatiellae bacterium]|nr:glycosyltransferase family 2 protein [Kiritimatiellia bacterium]